MNGNKWVYQITSRQIAALAAAILIAAMVLPIGVMAATGQFVNIRDYKNTGAGGQARVVDNKLYVSDGGGSLTVDGTVNARYAAPSTAFSVAFGGDQVLQDLVPAFTSGKMMITSFTFTHSYGSPAYSWIYQYTDNTCASQVGYFVYMSAESSTTASATFPTPVIVTQKCAHAWAGGYGLVTITGYLVP